MIQNQEFRSHCNMGNKLLVWHLFVSVFNTSPSELWWVATWLGLLDCWIAGALLVGSFVWQN